MSKVQKSLLGFSDKDENKKDKDKENVDLDDNKNVNEMEIPKLDQFDIFEEKIIRKANQIETDYYERSRIDTCAKRLRDRFHVNVEIKDVRYGKNPLLNEKIYGYYMIITVKSGDIEKIINFIIEECRLKVYR